jgi:hypothetical protein
MRILVWQQFVVKFHFKKSFIYLYLKRHILNFVSWNCLWISCLKANTQILGNTFGEVKNTLHKRLTCSSLALPQLTLHLDGFGALFVKLSLRYFICFCLKIESILGDVKKEKHAPRLLNIVLHTITWTSTSTWASCSTSCTLHWNLSLHLHVGRLLHHVSRLLHVCRLLHMSRLLHVRRLLHVSRLVTVQHPKKLLLSLLKGRCALQVKT